MSLQQIPKWDTDRIQTKIEKFIFKINKKNPDFDMMVQGSLRLDALTIQARAKQKVVTISHLIGKEKLVCPRCLKADRTGSDTRHFAICYRCDKRFIKPNRPKCGEHEGNLKPCSVCKYIREQKQKTTKQKQARRTVEAERQ